MKSDKGKRIERRGERGKHELNKQQESVYTWLVFSILIMQTLQQYRDVQIRPCSAFRTGTHKSSCNTTFANFSLRPFSNRRDETLYRYCWRKRLSFLL